VEQLSSTLKKLRTEEERWQLALLCSRDGVWEVKLDSREPPHYSPHIFDMLGLSPENPPDIAEWPKFFHPNDHKLLTLYRRFALWKDPPYSFELDHRLRCADGGYRWFMTRGMTLLDPVGGKPLRIIGVMADIQDRKEREEFFSYRATHDALTDLPNRMLFDEHLRSGIAVARRAGSYLAVVMVDLDRFKFINDTMGHHAGDQLLVEVAGRLLKNMRESDIASRLGGDEFAMILAFGKDELRAVTKVLERIMHALNKPVMLEDKEMLITASFGVSVYPNDGDLPKELMIRADEAMYHAKSLGRNACVFWQPDGRYSAVRFEAE
jgi:diguanylate cyclase (GGDEF)-like protein